MRKNIALYYKKANTKKKKKKDLTLLDTFMLSNRPAVITKYLLNTNHDWIANGIVGYFYISIRRAVEYISITKDKFWWSTIGIVFQFMKLHIFDGVLYCICTIPNHLWPSIVLATAIPSLPKIQWELVGFNLFPKSGMISDFRGYY